MMFFSKNMTAKEAFYFNPAFLSDDPAMIADLSRFEKGSEHLPGKYRVDVFVNENPAGTHEFDFRVDEKNGDLYPCLNRDMFSEFNVDPSVFKNIDVSQSCHKISDIVPDASSLPAFDKLRLDISIPQAWLRPEFRGYIPPERWDNGITAGFINYQYSGNHKLRGRAWSSQYLNLQGGLNIGPWRLRDYSTYSASGSRSEWQHVSTELQRTLSGINSVFTVGDTYSSGDIFNSVGLRGVTLETDESMMPENLQVYAPSVRGIARYAAKVKIKQNGYEIYQTNVQPGSFDIRDFYPSSSSGDLEVTVEEEGGRSETFIVPYSSVPSLLREGQKSYSLSLGRLYSYSSNDIAQAQLKWGMSAGLTLYGGLQAGNHYRAFALGGGKNLGTYGALSGDITHANTTLSDGSKHSGQSARFLYSKSLNNVGTTFQLVGYRYSSDGFFTLNESTWHVLSGAKRYAKKWQAQASISQTLGELGSLYLSLDRKNYWNTNEVDRSMQLGFNRYVGSVSYSVSFSELTNSSGPKDRALALNFSFPLGPADTYSNSSGFKPRAAVGSTFDFDGTSRHSLSVGGALLQGAKLTYDVNQIYDTYGNGTATNVSMGYRSKYGDVRTNYSHSRASQLLRTDFSGGLLLHSGGLTAGNLLGETNILVDTEGAEGVAIEGRTGSETNMFGYAIVGSASPYRENRISLDTKSFQDTLEAEDTVNIVVPGKGAIVKTTFATSQGRKALITLRRNGEPLPFGTLVSLRDGEVKKISSGIVGDDGQVFMSGLQDSGGLIARWGEGSGRACEANYTLLATSGEIPVIDADCR